MKFKEIQLQVDSGQVLQAASRTSVIVTCNGRYLERSTSCKVYLDNLTGNFKNYLNVLLGILVSFAK